MKRLPMRAVFNIRGIILLCVFIWHGPLLAHDEAAPRSWQAPHLADHTLVGKVWDSAARRFISPAALLQSLQRADFVLLGEVHGNKDHHRLQSRVIDWMVAHGRRPAVVFEMFERLDQPIIERVRQRYPEDADRIARATKMSARGWPWRLYKPLVTTVLSHGLPLYGADVSEPMLNKIVAHGLSALHTQRMEALALNEPLIASHADNMRAGIIESHCGHAPAAHIDGMVAAQRARDAWLADGLIVNDGGGGAVLIAGSGHVRNDFAVPAYLRRRATDQTIASVAFTEVTDRMDEPEQYATALGAKSSTFDFLWFTPRSQTRDPCSQFEQALRELKRR
jgi:uncharacterized iron-regulated protein